MFRLQLLFVSALLFAILAAAAPPSKPTEGTVGSLLCGAALATPNESDGRIELVYTEGCPVVFQRLSGAPDRVDINGKERLLRSMGDANHKKGVWAEHGKCLMTVCGYIFSPTATVSDVLPDAPKAGEALECKIVVKACRFKDGNVEPIDDYEFAWHTFKTDKDSNKDSNGREIGTWEKADVPAGPTLAKGITKDGERWACFVSARGANRIDYFDQVQIGAAKPGDSRVNAPFGWAYDNWRHVRGYLKFDVSRLEKKTVAKATLRIHGRLQVPPWKMLVFASSSDWKQDEITWVNQPVKFPCKDAPVGTFAFEREDPMKAYNEPRWYDIDITQYVKKAAAASEKSLSVCLTGEVQTAERYDHNRIWISNDLGQEKDKADTRPRLRIEVHRP